MEQSRETYSARREQLQRQRTEIDEELAEIHAFELQSKKLLGERARRTLRSGPRPTRTATS